MSAPNQLSELSRNLLSAARDGMSPDADVAARVRARVAAAVGAPAASAVVATPAKAASTALGVKVAGVLAVLGLAATAWYLAPRPTATHAPQVSAPASHVDEPRTSIHVAASEPAPPSATTLAPSAPPAPDAEITLAREVELIDLAMLALRRHAPEAALDAIAVYHREARGRGQMAQDAAAIAIEAHCALGRDARALLDAFDRSYPRSAQRARLADACR